MPSGVYIRTKKTREILSKAGILSYQCGRKSSCGMLGKKHTKEWKQKMKKIMSGKNNHQWKGGKKTSTQGYILIYQPNHPFAYKQGYVMESRLVAEKCLKRYLTRKEIIHHINKVKIDNRPKNLYLFISNSQHLSFEGLKNKPILESNLL